VTRLVGLGLFLIASCAAASNDNETITMKRNL
jgi:hypothetical protein